MSFDYMEDMAREYNSVLKANAFGADALLTDAIELAERQLDIIVAILYSAKPLNSSLSYLESLKRATLIDLNNLKQTKDVPQAKCKTNSPRGINALINMQIDLFINLDTISEKGLDVKGIVSREERACSVISLIR